MGESSEEQSGDLRHNAPASLTQIAALLCQFDTEGSDNSSERSRAASHPVFNPSRRHATILQRRVNMTQMGDTDRRADLRRFIL
jgi:hypothetical protein